MNLFIQYLFITLIHHFRRMIKKKHLRFAWDFKRGYQAAKLVAFFFGYRLKKIFFFVKF